MLFAQHFCSCSILKILFAEIVKEKKLFYDCETSRKKLIMKVKSIVISYNIILYFMNRFFFLLEVKGFRDDKISNNFFIGGLCLTYKMQKTMGTHMSNKPTYLVFITHNRCIWHSNSLQNVIQILLNGDLRYLQSGN